MNEEVTIGDIYRKLWLKFKQHKYHIENTYFFDWESDFFCISKAGYMYEFEVKMSYNDFKADFRKKDKHIMLENDTPYIKKGHLQKSAYIERKGYKNKSWYLEKDDKLSEGKNFTINKDLRTDIKVVFPNKKKPHKFIYVCPEGVIPIDEVPEYAGLMYCSKNKKGKVSLNYKKQPPFLHKEKWDEDKLYKKLLYKIYWSYRNLREYKYKIR